MLTDERHDIIVRNTFELSTAIDYSKRFVPKTLYIIFYIICIILNF